MNLLKFAERLNDLLFESHYNGLTLAEKLGCGKNTIYRYLQGGREPSVEMLVTLADFFNCSTDYLLGLEEENYGNSFEPCPAFNERFPQLLRENKITQYKLEQKTEISHSAMGYWKNGKKEPTVNSILKIAKELDCSVDHVLGRTK